MTRWHDERARTAIDIDDKTLALAAKELGTTSKIDIVNAALAFVAGVAGWRQRSFADPLIGGSPELAIPIAARATKALPTFH